MTGIKIKEKPIQRKEIPRFSAGDHVRIIDAEKQTDTVYQIKKLKQSYDGTQLYLLESETNPIKLIYHENEKSHLEKVD